MKPSTVAAAAVAVYAALLAWGFVAVLRREPAAWTEPQRIDWLAARDLPERAQLDSADLAAPADTVGKVLPNRRRLVGRHLLRAVKRDEPIPTSQVAPLTVGTPARGKIRFVLSAHAGDALALAQPGEALTPCVSVAAAAAGAPVTWDCTGPPFTVVTLHRRAAGDSLWAVLDADTPEQAARFVGAAGRLLVRRP